jgi:hypothetical protein
MITTRTAKQCGQADFGWLQDSYKKTVTNRTPKAMFIARSAL